jgi:hypothetical protein
MVWLSADCEIAQLLGGFRKAAVSGDGQEGGEIIQIAACH